MFGLFFMRSFQIGAFCEVSGLERVGTALERGSADFARQHIFDVPVTRQTLRFASCRDRKEE